MAIVHPDEHTWVPWLSWVRTFNPLPIGNADEETEGGGFNSTHWGKYLEYSEIKLNHSGALGLPAVKACGESIQTFLLPPWICLLDLNWLEPM